MKKILLTGLPAAVDPDRLRERLAPFGPIVRITKFTDGDQDLPWVIIEMDLDLVAAQAVARRIDGIYYNDRFINAHVMNHD